ncbi:MAG: hypothetical protein ACI9ON_002827 [Limisphaerales bacterium]
MTAEINNGQKSGRRALILIMSIAMFSLGGSYLLYYFASGSDGWGTTNHGAFVSPPATTTELGWPQPESRNWRLWVVADNQCDLRCGQKVKDLRALHILLNKEADRVRRGITLNGQDSAAAILPEAFPKLMRINLTGTRAVGEGVYIIDPNGNLVFHYALDENPKFILDDLKTLLKLSQIG